MHVLILVEGFPATSQTFINNQILSLLDLGIQVTILSVGPGPDRDSAALHASSRRILDTARLITLPPPHADWRRLAVLPRLLGNPLFHRIPSLRSVERLASLGSYHLQAMDGIGRAMQGIQCDLIFAHFGPNGLRAALLREAGRLPGRLVTFFHGFDVSQLVRERGPRFYDPLFAGGDGGGDGGRDWLVANSRFTQSQLVRIGAPPDRILLSAVGLEPADFPFRQRGPDPAFPVRFLSIGRLVEKKGHHNLIPALAAVRAAGIAATLTIVGDGPLRGELFALAERLGIAGAVDLVGACSQERIVELAAEAHLFVLASVTAANGDKEGQGLVLQEAQAMGLPVIATRHNGFPDSLVEGETGLLVPEGDVPALAQAMITLAVAPERWPVMGQAGARFVRENFDQTQLTRRLLARIMPQIALPAAALQASPADPDAAMCMP